MRRVRTPHTVRREGQLSDAVSLPTQKAATAGEHPGPSARPLRRGLPGADLLARPGPRPALLAALGTREQRPPQGAGRPSRERGHAAWAAASPNSE